MSKLTGAGVTGPFAWGAMQYANGELRTHMNRLPDLPIRS